MFLPLKENTMKKTFMAFGMPGTDGIDHCRSDFGEERNMEAGLAGKNLTTKPG